MADAFISYVEEDSELASEVARGLNEAGVTTWRYEADSVSGQNYLLQTRREIETCSAFVVILSRSSIGSEQVDREVVRAHECSRPFMPILSGMTYAEFSRRRPGWQQAMGAATALSVPEDGIDGVLDRLIRGVREVAGGGGDDRPEPRPPSFLHKFFRHIRSRSVLRNALIVLLILTAGALGTYAYLQKRAADARAEAAQNKSDAITLLNSWRSAEALPKIERAIVLTPNDTELYLYRGRAYYDMRQEEKALPDLNRRLAASPQDAEALYYRGMVHSTLRQDDLAMKDLSGAIAARTLSQEQQAAASFERAMLLTFRAAPDDSLRVTLSSAQRKDLIDAEADLAQAVKLRGWPPDLLERARVRMWLGRLAEAREDLREAYNRASQSPHEQDLSIAADAILMSSVLDLVQGDFSLAQMGFERVLSRDPGNPRALLYRAQARLGAGYADEAVAAMDKLVTQMPQSDPLRPAAARSLEEARKLRDGLPVKDLRLSIEPYVDNGTGTGAMFHVSCKVSGQRGKNLFGDVYIYEANGSPYEHEWLRVRAREKSYSTASGYLAASTRFTPTKDDASVDDLRIFLPYDQTPLYNGPQRYTFILRLSDEAGKTISSIIAGEISFTYPYPPR